MHGGPAAVGVAGRDIGPAHRPGASAIPAWPWLMRPDGAHIPLTQDHLATMLGARRPTVNLVLRQLRGAGVIRHARGQLAIAGRVALEAAACPCYRLMREAHERLLSGAFR